MKIKLAKDEIFKIKGLKNEEGIVEDYTFQVLKNPTIINVLNGIIHYETYLEEIGKNGGMFLMRITLHQKEVFTNNADPYFNIENISMLKKISTSDISEITDIRMDKILKKEVVEKETEIFDNVEKNNIGEVSDIVPIEENTTFEVPNYKETIISEEIENETNPIKETEIVDEFETEVTEDEEFGNLDDLEF